VRLAFDATTCVKARRGGVPNYGWSLVQACARVAPEHEYILAVRSHRWMRRSLIKDLLPGVRPRLLIDGLHGLTLGSPIDVLHGIGVRLPAPGGFAKTVMLHDLNVFEYPELTDPQWRRTRQQRIRETVARADLVISYSEQGAEALGEYVGLPREKVRVVPPGVDTTVFRRPEDDVLHRVAEQHDLLGRPYVLRVGGYSARKNPHGLRDAFADAALDPDWVLVLGGPQDAGRDALRTHARERGLDEDRLRLPGWVGSDDLPALLAGAACYVCSSLHEGFGLPVIEAQACGTAVASSNRGALLETVGDCGIVFDPTDRDDFASALSRLTGDEALRADLARRGPLRVAEKHGWDQVARRTLAVMTEAAALR
jgi:glycosyltransferase involved in cell wall biosynthesis